MFKNRKLQRATFHCCQNSRVWKSDSTVYRSAANSALPLRACHNICHLATPTAPLGRCIGQQITCWQQLGLRKTLFAAKPLQRVVHHRSTRCVSPKGRETGDSFLGFCQSSKTSRAGGQAQYNFDHELEAQPAPACTHTNRMCSKQSAKVPNGWDQQQVLN
jgi:hypothetical protein